MTRQLPPYAVAMGMRIEPDTDANTSPVIAMDFSARAMGRPGFFHGGAIGGLLEIAGFTALAAELDRDAIDLRIKPINISVEYLRAGVAETLFARGKVLRAGRRVANVQIEAWQADPGRPVASCWMNFQLSPRQA